MSIARLHVINIMHDLAGKDYQIMTDLLKLWRFKCLKEVMGTKDYLKVGLYHSFLYFNIVCVISTAFSQPNVIATMEVMAPVYAATEVCITYVAFFIQRTAYFDTIRYLQAYYDSHKSNEVDHKIMREDYQRAQKIILVFNVLLVVYMIFTVFMPVFVYLDELRIYGVAVLETPLKANYPWDFGHRINLLLAEIIQMLVVLALGALAASNIITPIYFFMGTVSAFKITIERFKDIQFSSSDKEAQDRLIVAIKSHQEALNLLQNINNFGNKHHFILIFAAAIGLSFGFFLLSCLKEAAKIILFSSLAAALGTHIFLFCYFGQNVKNEIQNITYEIYNVPWYNFSTLFKRSLMICLMRAQVTAPVAAWFTQVSMETFMSVLSTSYTYLAFLETMAE